MVTAIVSSQQSASSLRRVLMLPGPNRVDMYQSQTQMLHIFEALAATEASSSQQQAQLAVSSCQRGSEAPGPPELTRACLAGGARIFDILLRKCAWFLLR
mmetsp:Transcript_35798/g.69105  ORF Transcript_35798/g.69105 Transcript_35798/m.69105 type:complete len:100 (+) Transcript_35798:92-391(+)